MTQATAHDLGDLDNATNLINAVREDLNPNTTPAAVFTLLTTAASFVTDAQTLLAGGTLNRPAAQPTGVYPVTLDELAARDLDNLRLGAFLGPDADLVDCSPTIAVVGR